MDTFQHLYKKYLSINNPYLEWDKIELIDNNILINYNDLSETDPKQIDDLEKHICIIQLNGGLGTTLGCVGPKSLLEVKDRHTFLDITIEQLKKTPEIPLILMNSFYTHRDTNDYLNKDTNDHLNKISHDDLTILTYNQNCYPRIIKETKQPLDINSDNKDHLYPPGHGDLLLSISQAGLLDDLISNGIKYAFISNIDNLGATIDYKILQDLIKSDVDFALELTPKTLQDVKGGTLIKYDGKYKMFEVAQCPPNKLNEFTSIDKFKYFNTNNVWIKLEAIKKLVSNLDFLDDIDLILNQKKLKDGRECIQLEYAIGSMVKFFDKVKCYSVPRDRFIPVKTNKDLELIRSDQYQLDKETWTLKKA